jgi:hypothetical protein
MKRFVIFGFLLCLTLAGAAQDNPKNRKEIRKEKELRQIELIKKILDTKTFVFTATHALPQGGSSIYLSSSYDLKIRNDSAIAFLPYYGVAYTTSYGGDGGFDFGESIKNYESKPSKKGTDIRFEVNTKKDQYRFFLSVSELGYATLMVGSNNRQQIQFYGTIQEEEKEE